MATGQDIERRNHILGFKEEIAKAAEISNDFFFTWFDSATDKDSAFQKGERDFLIHIANPFLSNCSSPEEKVALEIGYGGGRLLAAGSKFFKKVIGIDIHEMEKRVDAELRERGISNFELYRSDGEKIPVNENSVDVVYSFIVLQHVEKIQIFRELLKESYRVLKPNGIAIIYFGRYYLFSIGSNNRMLYFLDNVIEKYSLRKGYKEIKAPVNCTNLKISLNFAKKICSDIGFEVVCKLISYKDSSDQNYLFGGQHGLVLKK